MPSLSKLKLGSRAGADVVGLDIQPGLIAAVKARVNGSILAERAAALPIGSDAVREGEVVDRDALSEALRELFADGRLGKRVRIGVANQRVVMRTLEMPPVTDRKELAAAVSFQAQDQVPMPLNNAVLDFHPLGVIDTPAGPRQRVVLVAAQRDMIEQLLAAVRAAGLHPEGVDLSAFALIRSLHTRDDEHSGRVLYLNVDGLTNLAIAEDTVCRFTRVVGGGIEEMAVELAERRGIPVTQARELLGGVDLTMPAPGEPIAPAPEEAPAESTQAEASSEAEESAAEESEAEAAADEAPVSSEEHAEREASMGYSEAIAAAQAPLPSADPAPGADADVRAVLENGIREISGEVRNSLDFHRTQEDGGEVSHVALSGAALDLPGFAEALQMSLGVEVRSETVGLADESLDGKVSTNRLAIATGLAAAEVPQ
jgi:type IV pilus assembly protein PilM